MKGTTSRRRTWTAIAASAALTALSAWFAQGQAAADPVYDGCKVDYTIKSNFSGGFVAQVDVTNLGQPVTSWMLTWSFGSGQTVKAAWGAGVTRNSTQVTAKNLFYNGNLPHGGATSFGFVGSLTAGATATTPGSFYLNGWQCTSTPGSTPTPTPAPHAPS
ncbi:cellulose binding domain-containing protein, partial [Streptomyces sp. H39-S7]|uniref:cellulose binding domain-containing protein n=1 Tax=Streptomyces sp. H39-S7 TaxID=3004357 RepID=UPI0022AF1FDB